MYQNWTYWRQIKWEKEKARDAAENVWGVDFLYHPETKMGEDKNAIGKLYRAIPIKKV